MDPRIGFGGDDTKALSRSAGFLTGLSKGFMGEMQNQDQQGQEAQKALRMMRDNTQYPSIPGKDIKPYLSEWNEETPFPTAGISTALAQYGQGKRLPAQQKLARDLADQRAALARWAVAKRTGGQAADAVATAHRIAKDLIGMDYASVSTPEDAERYQNIFNQIMVGAGREPMSLFGFEEQPTSIFGIPTGSTRVVRTLSAPGAPSLGAAPPVKRSAPADGGWGIEPAE